MSPTTTALEAADVLADLSRAGLADGELQVLLAAARTRPHSASPAAADEPAAAEAFLRRAAATHQRTRPVVAEGVTSGRDEAGAPGVQELLAAFAAGSLDPLTVHDAVHAGVVTSLAGGDGPFTATVAGSREAAAESATAGRPGPPAPWRGSRSPSRRSSTSRGPPSPAGRCSPVTGSPPPTRPSSPACGRPAPSPSP